MHPLPQLRGSLAAVALLALGPWARGQCPPAYSTSLVQGDPVEQAKLGSGLALHGSTAFAATYEGNAWFATTTVYVLERQGPGSWAKAAEIHPEAPVCNGVLLAANGDELFLGLPGYPAIGCGTGVVEVYARDSGAPGALGGWELRQKILSPPSQVPASAFGSPLEVDGPVLGVGHVQAGAVDVYERGADGTYDPVAVLDGDGTGLGAFAVSGSRIAAAGTEAVYLYERAPSGAWSLDAVIASPVLGQGFGRQVALEGDVLAIGADLANGSFGLARVYERDAGGSWNPAAELAPAGLYSGAYFPRLLELRDGVLAGTANGHVGTEGNRAIWTFARSPGGTWAEQGHLDPRPGLEASWFGFQLAAADGVLLASVIWADPGGFTNAGQVDVYEGLNAVGPAETYCTAGTSAAGCAASIGLSGAPSLTSDTGLQLVATGVEGRSNGLFFFGVNGRQALPWGTTGAFQCVAPPVNRGAVLAGAGTPGACDGSLAYDLIAHWLAHPTQTPPAGGLVQAQLWYRDPLSAASPKTNLSDAVELIVCP